MERYPLATLNRITVGLVFVSLALAGWIAYQRLDDNAPATPAAASHSP